MRHVIGVAIASIAIGISGLAQADAKSGVKTGREAFGDWRSDAPGVRRLIRSTDLPPARLGQSTSSFAKVAPAPAGATPKVPEGFRVEQIAAGLKGPRVVRVAPNGDLFVADSKTNRVLALRLSADGSKIEKQDVFAADLFKPYGIAFYPPGPDPRWVYIANADGVVRFAYKSGDMKAGGEAETLVSKIPPQHHWTRDIAFTSDGSTMYFSVGSGSNVALDMSPEPYEGMDEFKASHPIGAAWDTEDRRAAVLSFDPQGKGESIYATGLRNCSGLTVQPATGALWCVVNERDELGDNTPFEYAAQVKKGEFYGWPWFYIGPNEDPRKKGEKPYPASSVKIPDVLFQAHSAPLGIVFYEGTSFPADYKGDAFVTFHGSWNRGKRTGYKVVRMIFEDGKPTGEYEDFLTGFVGADGQVWGRPVGVAVAKDGSLIVTEDGNGTVWRVSYAENASP